MIGHAVILLLVYLGTLVLLAVPLGSYVARVYEGQPTFAGRVFGPVERGLYRAAGVREGVEMGWRGYAGAVLVFNLVGCLAVYGLQRLQAILPLNPLALPAVSPPVAFNTAVSFATNTNWQCYGGETTMSFLVQMAALTVQNFVSAATGMAVLAAVIRGLARRETDRLGNFWVDLTRVTLYVLLPLSLVLAVVLISQGVVQTFRGSVEVPLLSGDGQQTIALGPVASQVAIKQLGTNGGGFFNVNSAHPFENPTPLSNFLELLAILLLPASACFSFGRMVNDRRQGWALFAAMLLLFVPLALLCMSQELGSVPNLEGKELRFGAAESGLWAAATTAASNGSVNAMHDSFTPLGGLVPLVLMQLGEVVFGGVGSGLYGLLLFAVVAVFLAGLMVGRTPEYLGKKIEAKEMKMASLGILVPAATVLGGTAIACLGPWGRTTTNPGAHGFSEILYAFSSSSNNNGSAFAGLGVSGLFYATAQGITMLIGRYWVIVPALAMAGSLARKRRVPPSAGTLPTHRPLFIALLAGTVVFVGALTFLPALALGPIVEQIQLRGGAP